MIIMIMQRIKCSFANIMLLGSCTVVILFHFYHILIFIAVLKRDFDNNLNKHMDRFIPGVNYVVILLHVSRVTN